MVNYHYDIRGARQMNKDRFVSPTGIHDKIIRIYRGYHHFLEGRLKNNGLHKSQHMVLMYLEHKGVSSQKEIAAHFSISPAAIAVTLKKLEKGGFISRVSSNSDSRFNEVQITEIGRSIVEHSHTVFEDATTQSLMGINAEEQERLGELLDRMLINLETATRKEV